MRMVTRQSNLKGDKMAVKWEKANPTVLKLAEQIVGDYHKDLLGADIGFLFRETAPESHGVRTLGKAQKVPDRLRPFINFDFIIWIAADAWAALAEAQRRALLDHELSHCKMDADGRTWIQPHDIEAFTSVLDRWGMWHAGLFRARGAMKHAVQTRMKGVGDGSVAAFDPKIMESAKKLKDMVAELVVDK